MAAKNKTVVKRNGKEITYARILNAPRKLVWSVWTEPDHVKEWWGPDGFSVSHKSMEVKAGGSWLFTMHGLGKDFPNKIIFLEVIKPERLVYRHAGDDDSDPVSFHVTVTFEALRNKTRLTMHAIFASTEELDKLDKEVKAIEGAKQHLDRLEKYVINIVENK